MALELDESTLERLRAAGLCHDLGKFLIPEEVLAKPGALCEEEQALLARHAADGAEMSLVLGLDPVAADYVRFHHARCDEPGAVDVPDHPIPQGARILALADALVAMTSYRSYQPERSFTRTVREVQRESGGQFDPEVASAVPRALLSDPPASVFLGHIGAPIMGWLRRALHRLGWPIDSLSDEDITRELGRKWFASSPGHPHREDGCGVAAATGIFVSMAREGNLDALCWADQDDAALLDVFTVDEVSALVERTGRDRTGDECPEPDRRSSPRIPADDLVQYGPPSRSDGASGWLVDASAKGIAFMAETGDAPAVGTRIFSTIRERGGGTAEFGPATVVRTELLNETLSLVCVQLEESGESN
jgi:hypothetical protein